MRRETLDEDHRGVVRCARGHLHDEFVVEGEPQRLAPQTFGDSEGRSFEDLRR